MKELYSWNVNGIRSCWAKGLLQFIQTRDPEVICLQEIKCKKDQFNELKDLGYFEHWNSAEKPGYSGTLTLSRTKPIAYTVGIQGESDPEGRVQCLEFESCFIVNSYFPNSQRDHARLPYKLDFCRKMQGYLKALSHTKPVLLCGDLNIAHKEIDLKNPKQNKNNAGFLPQERAAFDGLLEVGMLDAFRIFCQDGDQYTWWSARPGVREKNIGWRLDYFLVSANGESHVKDCRIYPKIKGSDHCPVGLSWVPSGSSL